MAFAQPIARPGRPIEGAVATQGVSDRVAFLRKTYGLLGVSLIAFAAFTAGMMRFATETSFYFSSWATRSRLSWFLVLMLFAGVGYVAQRMSFSQTSRAVQYLGLAMTVVVQSLLLQPILWGLIGMFGNRAMLASGVLLSGQATVILMQAVGLTLTVFLTKKDFSFLRGALTVGLFAAMGVILASLAFGFSLGALFCGAIILLMAGYILYETSLVMSYFPPQAYVAAATYAW